MPPPTPDQIRTRARFETVIKLVSPALDLMLAAGERLSHLVEPEDTEYQPPRRRSPAGGEPARTR